MVRALRAGFRGRRIGRADVVIAVATDPDGGSTIQPDRRLPGFRRLVRGSAAACRHLGHVTAAGPSFPWHRARDPCRAVAGLVRPTDSIWVLGIGVLLAGSHLMASFRGLPPVGVFGPRAGVPSMIFWYGKPFLATLVVGTATTAWAARIATTWVAFSWLLLLTSGVVAWGLVLVDKRDRRS